MAGLRQQQKEALERLGQQHQDALSSKDSELESTRQSLTELSSEAAELRSKLTGQSVELDSLKAQFEGEARRRQETEATVARLKEELNQGESLQAARGNELKSLEERLRERDQVIDELQRKFEEALRESREQQLSRENERSDEVNRFSELQGEVQALRESLADKERELLARSDLKSNSNMTGVFSNDASRRTFDVRPSLTCVDSWSRSVCTGVKKTGWSNLQHPIFDPKMSFHRREALASSHRAKTETSRGFEVKRSMQVIYRALD